MPADFVEAVFTNRPAFWPTMPAMRLRIVHQLSLLLVATALLSVAAVGGFVAWNLKAGFSDYLRARDRQRKLINKIDAALARIEDGSYGYCEDTGEPIGIKRLDARPIATLSLEAQERHERREKVFRED